MLRDMTIGQFYPVDSPIHALDPRTKLMALVLYVATLFLVRNPTWFVVLLAMLLVLYRVANVPFTYFLKGLRTLGFLLVFTFLFRMVITPGEVLASFWIFEVTREGLVKGTQLMSRIGLMIAAASLLSYTTTPKNMADGLARACKPLERLGMPVRDMATMSMIAFRFIPVMLEETNNLMDAQASRGVEFENCSVLTKCRNVFSLVMPLFMKSLERSVDLATAMEARGYTSEGPTSKMYPLVYTRNDAMAYALGVCLLVAAIVLRVLGLL